MSNMFSNHCKTCAYYRFYDIEGGKGYRGCSFEGRCSLAKTTTKSESLYEYTAPPKDLSIAEFVCSYRMFYFKKGWQNGAYVFKVHKDGLVEGNVFLKEMSRKGHDSLWGDNEIYFNHIMMKLNENDSGKIVPEFRFIVGDWLGYEDSIFCNSDGTLSDGRTHSVIYDYETFKALEVR